MNILLTRKEIAKSHINKEAHDEYEWDIDACIAQCLKLFRIIEKPCLDMHHTRVFLNDDGDCLIKNCPDCMESLKKELADVLEYGLTFYLKYVYYNLTEVRNG